MPVWEEPVRGGFPDPALWTRTGLEQCEAFIARVNSPAPPIHHLTGMRPTAVGPGTGTFTMPASPWLAGPTGHVLQGMLAVLADGPLGCAIQTTLPPATPYTTSELSMSYLRPVQADGGELVCHGHVVHGGRSLALSEARVEDASGRLVAHATSRCYLFPPAPVTGRPPLPELSARTYDDDPWMRPVLGAPTPPEVWRDRSGLEIVRGWISGDLPAPPLHHLTGQMPIAGDEGTATFSMPASGWLCSPAGTVEGGVLAMLADAAIATAVQTTVPAGTAYAPADVTVKFVRPVLPDDALLTAVGRVLHRGRTMAVATSEVRNAEGKLVVTAIGSALIMPGRDMTGPRVVVPDEDAVTE